MGFGLGTAKSAGLISFNPKLNEQKPLAMIDYSGWAYFSELLLGSVSESWFTGFSLAKNKYMWFLPTKAQTSIPPMIIGSSLFIALRDGSLQKVDPFTGAVAWKIELDSYINRPLLNVGSVLLGFTASQILYAIDLKSGKTEWLYDSGFPESLILATLAKIIHKNDTIYLGLNNGEIASVNLKTGTEIWRYNPVFSEGRFKDVVGEMAILNDNILVSRYDGFVGALELSENPAKINVKWRHLLGTISTSAYRDGRYYVGTVAGELICFDGVNGTRIWRTQLSDAVANIFVDENRIYISGSTGFIGALDTKDGKILWHDHLMARLTTEPLFFNDKIYFSTGYKNLYGFEK